jgi:hypothetical protein
MDTTANPALSPAAAPERAASRRLPWLDRLTLVAVLAAVVVVTIPHLRSMAIRANERDARVVLTWLGEELAKISPAELPTDLPALLDRLPRAARRVPDARILDSGLVAHHGYYLRLALSPQGTPELSAWPCQTNRTGHAAYAWTTGSLYEHANSAATWSGEDRPPPPDIQPAGSEAWTPRPSER